TLALLSGQAITVKFNATNGASPTLNVDSLGAKAIHSAQGTAVATGAILANSIWRVTYDNANSCFVLNAYRPLLSTDLTLINSLTEDTSPDIAADFFVTYDTSASAVKKVKPQSVPSNTPRGYIAGCILSNGTDATNDIDFTAGTCRDSTNAVDIVLPA